MGTLGANFQFELRYHVKRPTFWLVALVFGAFGFADMVSNGSHGNAFFFVNSPSQVFQTTIWYSLFSVLAATAFVAETFVRDSRCGIEDLFLATPISKFNYLGVRFLAAITVTVLAFSCYLPGMMIASIMPGLNPYAIGPFRVDGFMLSYVGITLPNLFFVCVFSFVVTSAFRNMIAGYVGAIVLVMFYIAAMLMVGVEQIDYNLLDIWTLLDPYGYFALEASTLSWTVHQHNHQMPPLGDTFILNRVFWVTLSCIAWFIAYKRFDMRPNRLMSKQGSFSAVKTRHNNSENQVSAATTNSVRQTSSIPTKLSITDLSWRQLPRLVVFELHFILRSRAFQLLMFCGLVSLLFAASGSSSFEHSNPSTDILIHTASMYFDYVLFAIIVFYAAELTWRNQDLKIQGVVDATPLPSWLMVLSKLFSLFIVIGLNLLLCMVVLVAYQAFMGYYHFELGLSALMLFGIQGPYFYFFAVLALFAQAVTRQKYAGMMLVLLIALLPIPFDAFGLYHNLYRFGATNDFGYSPMNGFGHLLAGHWWFVAYWAAVSTALAVLTIWVWPRGQIERRFVRGNRSRGSSLVLALGGAMSVVLAGWIFYNTTVLNTYQPPGKDLLAVAHEKKFKQYEKLPMPVVIATDIKLDMYPEQRYFLATGSYQLRNATQQPINELHVSTFINLKLVKAEYPGATLKQSFPEWGYYIYSLKNPLMPGDEATLKFVTRTDEPEGFRNQSDADDVYMIAPNEVINNGTSLYSPFILPFIGYTKMVEHKEAWLRHKYDLPPLDQRMRSHDDLTGLAKALTVSHLTWGKTNLVASTDQDQQVVSSGVELNRWQEAGRSFVHYQSEPLHRGKFTLYSAQFSEKQVQKDSVPITAYYHPFHESNVAPMLNHLAEALSVYEDSFGTYPYEQLRLVEFAYYPGMVFSDGGTIGLPEVLVWKANLDGPGEDAMIGWLSYLLAHCWWEDQLIVADVAGGMSIREALSGYASNLYRRHIYDDATFTRVKQQQQRDFFRALGQVDFAEPPLVDVYNEVLPARFKGQMILEQIESQIGKEALLTAIQQFLIRFKNKAPPYATILDLQAEVLAHAPLNLRQKISELFTDVVTYRFGILDAGYQKKGDSEYWVKVDVEAQKLITQALGEHKAHIMDWPLHIVVENESGETIYRDQFQFNDMQQAFELSLDQRPYRIVLDPGYYLPASFSPRRERIVRPI